MDPSSLIFITIVVIWGFYLVGYWIRRRDHLAEIRSVEEFAADLQSLERRPPRARSTVPVRTRATSPPARMAQGLAALAAVSLLTCLGSWIAFLFGGVSIAGASLSTGFLVGVFGLLRLRVRRSQAIRRQRDRRDRHQVTHTRRQGRRVIVGGLLALHRDRAAASAEAIQAARARADAQAAADRAAEIQAAVLAAQAQSRQWQPVPVPAPTYTLKARADQPAPVPVASAQPAAPTPEVAAEREDQAVEPSAPEVAAEAGEEAEFDLDEILARRIAASG